MTARDESDRAARLAAQTVFDRPLLLEAGAGTGKTTTLVARALCWCLGPGWARARADLESSSTEVAEREIGAQTLQGVIAITFTEAAAAEMAERLASSLASIVDGREAEVTGLELACLPPELGSDERRLRAEQLLESFDYLTVGTIHAFCYGLLRTYPLEAGLHPELRIDADGRELEAAARVAVESWTQTSYSANDEGPFLTLASHGIGPGRLLEAVVRWYAEGPSIDVLEPDPLDSESIDGFLSRLRQRGDRVLALLGERLHDIDENRVARRVERAIRATSDLLSPPRPSVPADLHQLLEAVGALWPDTESGRVRSWGRGKLPSAEERDRLAGLGEDFRLASETLGGALRTALALDPQLLVAARQALLPLLRQVDAELRSRGVIAFSGLLRETLGLLQRSPSVLQRERQRIRLLLVDEFQDTDPVQSKIVELLALAGPLESRPSLFVVGDPKQSIYAWRDADLAAYEAFESTLRAQGGESYALDVNFRSVPEVLADVERVIAPVMRYEHGIQPEFHGLSPSGQLESSAAVASGLWRSVEYWVSWRPDPETGRLEPGSHAEAQEVEAYELAADIKRLHETGRVAWSDIGVLFRKGGSQPPFLEEMRRQGVPFSVTRDRHYYQRREVIEAAAWVRAVVNPTDHLALLTVLRSIVIGVPDAALIPLWSRSFPKLATELGGPDDPTLDSLREVVFAASSSISDTVPGLERITGWEENLLAGLRSLARLRRSHRRDPADVFVRSLRRELLVEVSEAARFQGEFRLANLGRFFRQLETAMQSDEADVHAILRALRLGVTEGRDAQEAMPRDAAEEAVQVMTIHTAKGLEFDHVYVVQMHAGTRSGSQQIVEANEVEPGDWQYHLFGAHTLGYERAEARRARIEAAETVRTLYVAMTRACQRIVLVGTWPARPTPVDPLQAGNHIDLLRNRSSLPESLCEPANDPQVQLLGEWDHDGVRWRFLGAARSVGTGRPKISAPDWLPGAEATRRISRSYTERQDLARQRMLRPWSEAVTAGTSERLEAAAATFEAETHEDRATTIDRRRVAREIGTAIHDCLETWKLDADPREEAARQRTRLRDLLVAQPEAIEGAMAILDRFANGSLLPRLMSLGPGILGREIPALVSVDDECGPVACYAGAIDLLYRDPASGELVVADFKTDRIDTAEELEARAEVYRRQEQRYAGAVQEMMALEHPPRTELWFLWSDRILTAVT